MFFEHPGCASNKPTELSHRDEFEGLTPVFPLGSLTLLPNVVQPFHMFEPRYRKLAQDAVEGDGFITLAILKPAGAEEYETKTAPIYPWACVGRISRYEPMPDGRWNLIVRGLWRGKILSELDDSLPYRTGRIEPVDECTAYSSDEAEQHRRELVDLFTQAQPKLAAHPAVAQALGEELPIDLLSDFVAHALTLDPTSGAAILKEASPVNRCKLLEALLGQHLAMQTKTDRPFPPKFSDN